MEPNSDALALLTRQVSDAWARRHPDEPLVTLDASATVAEQIVSALEAVGRSPWADAVGPVLRTSTVRQMLGEVTRQALLDRVNRHKLLALRTSDGHLVWPVWQFKRRSVAPGVADVVGVGASSGVDPWTFASWVRAPLDAAGGRSVAELLSGSDPDDVVLAVHLAEAAASRWANV